MTAYFNTHTEKADGLGTVQAARLATRPAQAAPRLGGLYRNGAKRVLDVVLILAALPIILPVVLVLAFLVKRDGGPAFYSQVRVGKNGRLYRMWKLRSMVPGADAKLAEHLDSDPVARAEPGGDDA